MPFAVTSPMAMVGGFAKSEPPAATLVSEYGWRDGPTDYGDRFQEKWSVLDPFAPLLQNATSTAAYFEAVARQQLATQDERARAAVEAVRLWQAGKIPAFDAADALRLYRFARGPGYVLYDPYEVARHIVVEFRVAKQHYHRYDDWYEKGACAVAKVLTPVVPYIMNKLVPKSADTFLSLVNDVDPKALERASKALDCPIPWQAVVERTSILLRRVGYVDLNEPLGELVLRGAIRDRHGHPRPIPNRTLPKWVTDIRYAAAPPPSPPQVPSRVGPAPSVAKYPPGSVARFNTDTKRWSIYVPLSGAGAPPPRTVDRVLGWGFATLATVTAAGLVWYAVREVG